MNTRYGITEEYIVDDYLFELGKTEKIICLEDLQNPEMKDCIILLRDDREEVYSEIRYKLRQYVELEKIVDVFSGSMYFDTEVYFDKPYSDRQRICTLEYTAREIYKNNVEGAIAECGVFRGGFANYMNRFMPD